MSCLTDGQPIRTQGVLYTGRQNLNISSLTTSDAGIYVCTATNKATGAQVQRSAELTVYGEYGGGGLQIVEGVLARE